eukprot:768267-Hanusia_phi.AAC.5
MSAGLDRVQELRTIQINAVKELLGSPGPLLPHACSRARSQFRLPFQQDFPASRSAPTLRYA